MKKNRIKRMLSMAVAMTMAAEMLPIQSLSAASDYTDLVPELAKFYDGDEEAARSDLDYLYYAGIIDAKGNMVELDIREDGISVTLEDVTDRLAAGEGVGTVTVNGHTTYPDQLMKIKQLKTQLELIKLLDEDIEITDEHVANLQSLLEGISDGSVDLDSALMTGSLTLKSPTALNNGPTSTTVSTGDVTLSDADKGEYKDKMVNGATYDSQYSFTLLDPSNKKYYTDSTTNGIVADGIITLSCADTATCNSTITVTATLNKELPYPVTFDWSVGGGGFAFATSSGSVTIEAGETEATFDVTVPDKEEADLWDGSRAFVISVGNVKNALLDDDEDLTNDVNETKTAWSKTVKVSSSDKAAINNTYPSETILTCGEGSAGYTKSSVSGTIDSLALGNYLTITLSGEVNFNSSVLESASDIVFSNNGGSKRITFGKPGSKSVSCTLTIDDSWKSIVDAGTVNVEASIYTLQDYRPAKKVKGLTIEKKCPSRMAEVSSLTVPEGTYYSGQIVPITVKFDKYVVANTSTIMKVNNVECSPLDTLGTETNTITFGYVVKDVETAALNITSLTGLVNSDNKTVNLPDSYDPTTVFSPTSSTKVTLVSKVKESTLDFANVKYGIDDKEPLQQTATVFIPFKSDAALDWVANEDTDCTTKGNPLAMPVPGYANATASAYINSAYFSYDNGKKRYPVYYVKNSDGTPLGLAAKIAPPANETGDLRLDTLNLFMDMNGTVTSAATYLDAWTNKKTDTGGYAYFYFEGDTKTAAPIAIGRAYSYYVKGGVFFELTTKNDQDEDVPVFTSRGHSEDAAEYYADKVENGWLKTGDNSYVLLNDAANPDNQYDVEIVANDAFYNAVTTGARAEDNKDLTLKAQFSDRKNFTFTDPKYFTWTTWTSSDEEIATVETDKNGVAHISLTGQSGEVKFTLHVGNCVPSKAYDVPVTADLTVLEGKTPFLNIPTYSQNRITLTNTDTDIQFASNLTARNDQAKKYQSGTDETENYTTVFTAKLIKDGTEVWTGTFNSTINDPISHITVPGDKLTAKGEYTVEISATYVGGDVNGASTPKAELSATANLTVKQKPATIKLNKLNSYYVKYDGLPSIDYTVSEGAEVEYTIQKSGDPFVNRIHVAIPLTNDYIEFAPEKPDKLKESYTITVYARNSAEDAWSVDSMLLTVYNPDILEQIVKDVTAGEIGGTTGGKGDDVEGTTVNLDNHGKIATNYGVDEEGEYKLTFEDFTALRTDMSLQKIVSVNYGEATYGLLSDKMQWESSDSSLASINYKQGGIYSDIRNYSYTSYTPATDFLLVAKDNINASDKVTITATHANTGITSSFDVTAATLKNQLYVFKFNPAVETDVTYTNGAGERRTLKSNEKGELAVYEPTGIASPVMTMSIKDGKTYVGTLYPSDLATGERDIASLQLYPCNNLRLRAIANADLTFLKPDGSAYSGQVTIRGGVYKNGVYCPGAKIRVGASDVEAQSGRTNINATVTNGKLNLTLDPIQFNIDSTETQGAQPGDKITYVFEYSFGNNYRPGYVVLNASTDVDGASSPTDSLIQMLNTTGDATQPQIIRQNIQQYSGNEATSYTRNVINFTDNIGVSAKFNKTELTTEIALLNETVSSDTSGFTTYDGDKVTRFALYTPNNKKLTGQTADTKTTADQIINLSDMDNSTLFVFPFSSVPIARSTYTMTDSNLNRDGITDRGTSHNPTSIVKAMYERDGMTIKSETLPFGVSNLSHQKDLSQNGGGAKEIGKEINDELKSNLDMGSIFGNINVNEMLQKGFVFLSKIQGAGGNNPTNMMIMPTEDPGKFRIVAFIGEKKAQESSDDGVSVNYDSNQMYDDMEAFEKELKEMEEEKKKNKSKKNEDSNSGEASFDLNYYGAVVLEAKVGALGGSWDINFCGGTVGTNFEAKYDWSQNFMCGPVPVTVSFTVKGTADLEVSFANKEAARALLIDAAVGVSIDAFAGLGFDYSLIALKLGIFGNIGARDNFLYLTEGNNTGNKLDISGEIGIKLAAKIAMVSYEKVFCSTGFNWSKEWGSYSKIKKDWESLGYSDLTGVSNNGQNYEMRLMPDGTAMITIDGGNRIENRDYLKSGLRSWKNPIVRTYAPSSGAIQENAYPYSNPVVNDDGSLMLYISDNNNSEKLQSVVCYTTKNNNYSIYDQESKVDNNTSEKEIFADSSVVVSGTEKNTFAAWVKQLESPDKEMKDKATNDDLGMMLNASEIYVGSYKENKWTTERLTNNSVADMAPTIASRGDKAIVAWRSLSASAMPEEGSEKDLTAMFNVEDCINYRIYNGTEWVEAKVAYNGSAGTVNAIDSAMLSDGTAILVYTVRTGSDVKSSETFYTVIDNKGDEVTTGRLTNDGYIDTNAQVKAVDDQFVIAWYSEHDAGEGDVNNEAVVSHDIGLARINANGSLDASFPESIGGTSSSSITSDFKLSAPAGCDNLNQLSIVWSQQSDSDKAEDAGKYQLKAVRFYKEDNVISVSSPKLISETDKDYTIDKFDIYTGADGTINSVLIGSDYSDITGISVYDTIDLTNLSPLTSDNTDEPEIVESNTESEFIDILVKNPTSSMKFVSGSFDSVGLEAEANYDLYEMMPSIDMPVQFTVKNTGTSKINTVSVQISTQNSKSFTDLDLLPGQSTVLTVEYDVPETIADVNYILTANGSRTTNGTLTLNRPDVGIASMKITRESEKTRDVQVILANGSNIPLKNSDKTVKLEFYKDSKHSTQIGETITIPTSAYQDIDEDHYAYTETFDISTLIGTDKEVPDSGVNIYAKAWVVDTEELYTGDNTAMVTLKGLLSKYKSQITMDSALIMGNNGTYTVNAEIRNNSLQDAAVGSITADILDSNNKVLTSVELATGDQTLTGEQIKALSSAAPEFTGTPASVSLRSSKKTVLLDAGSGSCEVVTMMLTTDNKISGTMPEATRSGYSFKGWYTLEKDGEKDKKVMVTSDTVLEGGQTLYAQYEYIPVYSSQSWTLEMEDYEYDGTAHTPTINGEMYGDVTYTYYNADTEEELDSAPIEPGNYRVKVFAEGGSRYYSRTQTTYYSITAKQEPPAPTEYVVNVKNGTINSKTIGTYAPDTILVAKASNAPDGYKFAYWKKNGVTVSYSENYTFPLSRDMELEAFYTLIADEFQTSGTGQLEGFSADKENGKLQISVLHSVPNDCKILKAGLVATSDISKLNNLTAANADFVRYKENITAHNYKYTWTKTQVTADQTWYVRSYLEYKDAEGKTRTVYGDLVQATLDGYKVQVENKIVGASNMEDVKMDKENHKISFAALMSVPVDCKIKFAGVVATSDASKKDYLTKITATEKSTVNGCYVRGMASNMHTVKFTWTKTNVDTETWYVRSYLVYEDANGKTQYVYGDLTTAKLN